MAQMLMWKDTVNNDLYNHGGPTGMKTILTDFVADYRAREAERERARIQREMEEAERLRNRRFKITIVSSAIFLIISTILGWILTLVIPAAKAIMDDYYQRHPAALVQHSYSNQPYPAYAENRQEVSHY